MFSLKHLWRFVDSDLKEKKGHAESVTTRQVWRCKLIEPDTRLQIARSLAKTETEASMQALLMLKCHGQAEKPLLRSMLTTSLRGPRSAALPETAVRGMALYADVKHRDTRGRLSV